MREEAPYGKVDPAGGLHQVDGIHCAGLPIGGGTKGKLGLVFSSHASTIGCAVYTTNDVKAAPVLVSRRHDGLTPAKRAVLINSGAANAFTGRKGVADAEACAARAASALGIEPGQVYIGSTGAIGVPLPLDGILAGIDRLAGARTAEESGARAFATAIMTTDTRPKQASLRYLAGGAPVTIAASLKGAGMLMPNMATMLCVVATDACISPDLLSCALGEAVEETFHHATVDGDTSTNDSVFVLATGQSGAGRIAARDGAYREFVLHLTMLLEHLVKEMVGDGEGITKFITIRIGGVPTDAQGKAIAFSIANSPLVKTAMFGEQLNWGRILMAAGKAGTGLDFGDVDLDINQVAILRKGEIAHPQAVQDGARAIRQRDILVELHLNRGRRGFTAWTCDYSLDYVRINADYLT